MVQIAEHAHGDERARRVLTKLEAELGPVLLAAVADQRVTDIWRNEDGSIWVNVLGQGAQRAKITMPDDVALNLIGTVSGWHGVEVSAAHPFLEAELPLDGSRFSAAIQPVVRSPILSITKMTTLAPRGLDDYLQLGAMTAGQVAVLRASIKARESILVVGPQASGKTTLVQAIVAEMAAACDPTFERFGILQDTVELTLPAGFNGYSMRTNVTTGVHLDELVRRSLRHRATTFVVGEVRGREARALLDLLTTGHRGVATAHAGSAREGLRRVEQMVRQDGSVVDRSEIASAFQVVVVITRTASGRVVRDISRVLDGTAGGYLLEALGRPSRLYSAV